MQQQWAPPPPPIKPGIVPLRPLGLTEILDGAFTAIRRAPGLMLGVAVLVGIVSSIVQLALTLPSLSAFTDEFDAAATNPDASFGEVFGPLGGLVAGSVIGLVVSILLQSIGAGLLMPIVGRAVLGQRLTAGEWWAACRPRLLPLIGLVIAFTAAWIAGFFLLVVPAVFIYVVWSLATPVMMLERRGVIDSLKRSYALVRGSFWRVFGILLLATIVANVVGSVVSTPFAFVGAFLDGSFTTTPGAGLPLWSLALSTVGSLLGIAIVMPFTAGVTALLYIDQRMRREAFDIELIAATRPTTDA
jgi:hypothetical protein